MPIALGPNTNGPASTMPSMPTAAAVGIDNLPTPSIADARQAEEQREAAEVTPMLVVPDSPRARRIRESAAAMVMDEPGLSMDVALDRADAMQTWEDEREAMALLELEREACAAHDAYADHSRCARGFCMARSSYGYHD